MRRLTLTLIPIFALMAAGCGDSCCRGEAKHQHEHSMTISAPMHAVAVLQPTQGNATKGVVTFTEANGKVRIVADVEGLTPNGKHAIHIHEFGDANSPDGASAGGHYNPEGHVHAGPHTKERHAGDLGNLQADGKGKAHYELTIDDLSVAGARNPIVGRSVVVHAKEDDFATQPSGNAGARILVGVVGVAKPVATPQK